LPSERDEIRRLLKQLHVLRLTLYLSFAVGVVTTMTFLFLPLPYFPGAGPAVPAAQTTFASTTVTMASTTATVLFTSTTSRVTNPPSIPGGYGVAGPPTPSPLNNFGVTALVSWTVFGAALIWRGHVRSVWGQSRFSYDTFRLLVKMRGAQTRLKLMYSLNPPKNKLQLATALEIDWKAVDKHVQVLEKNGLIHASSTSGTATFYEVTEKGKDLLQVLEQLGAESSPDSNPHSG
jgi:predicted transcriptional regulator